MVGVHVARTDIVSRVAHRSIREGRSLGLRHEREFDRRCSLLRAIISRSHMTCTKSHVLTRHLRRASSGAPTDSLGRARGDGWDAAGGPVPRAETRISCLFKHLSFTRGEHVAWEDPRLRGTCRVAPRPPAFSPQAPPVDKQEVSPHSCVRTRPGKVHVERTSARIWGAVSHQRFFLGLGLRARSRAWSPESNLSSRARTTA